MKFFILPFLIAANHQLQNRNEIYENGPEITFNVTYSGNLTTPAVPECELVGQLPKYVSYESTSQMKCQYNTPDYLHCYMDNSNSNISNYFANTSRNGWVFQDHTELMERFGLIEFDLMLSKYGIEDLLVPEDMDETNYDELRISIYPLHTGVDPEEFSSGYRYGFDTFLTGNCSTAFTVSGYNPRMIDTDFNQNTLMDGDRIIIHKRPNINLYGKNECGNIVDKVRLSREMVKEATLGIASANSYQKATDNTFEASIHYQGEIPVLKTLEKTIAVSFTGDVKIVYDSVAPAKNKFKIIKNPKSIGLMIGKPLKYTMEGKN